jgi:fermentation-respiration switch protein FrsA (DUF1100 family)
VRRIARQAVAFGGTLLLALILVQGARAAYAEYRAAVPRRGPVRRPDDGSLPASAEDVVFRTPSGHAVHAWWIPGKNGAAVVLVGGSGSDRRSLVAETRALSDAGFAVLSYDNPGHGESEGPADWIVEIPSALGAALDFVGMRPGVDGKRIGAMGFSMGASSVSSVGEHDPRVAAIALVGCYTDADDQTRAEYARWGPVQSVPAIWVMRAFGIGKGALRPIDKVASFAPRPLLLVAGSNDKTVPPWMAHDLYAAAREPKELYVVDGADHGNFAEVAPVEYARRIAQFFEAALLGKS